MRYVRTQNHIENLTNSDLFVKLVYPSMKLRTTKICTYVGTLNLCTLHLAVTRVILMEAQLPTSYKLTTEWQMPRNPKHKGSLYRHSGDVDERDADFGTHSMRKMPTTYSVHLGCSRDRVEIQGRWKGRRGSNIVDRYLK